MYGNDMGGLWEGGPTIEGLKKNLKRVPIYRISPTFFSPLISPNDGGLRLWSLAKFGQIFQVKIVPYNPLRIERDLTNGSLSRLLELLNSQV